MRATGGLDDTVEEWDAERKAGTGFKFVDYSPKAFLDAIDRALAAFHNTECWQQLMENAMAQNFSWDEPVREYAEVYEEVAKRRN